MILRLATLVLAVFLLVSCSSGPAWQNSPQTHIVRKGETLFAIAWRYGRTTNELARWNQLGNGSLIYPGQVLQLSGPAVVRRSGTATTNKNRKQTRPLPSIPAQAPPKWSWPTSGKINVEFGKKPGTGTGVLINGKPGQFVRSAAAGRVVYAGSGLIGYGKLIILKHNETYLTAYGYNATLMVKEGDTIARGQKIATMGEGPERTARLHFEIRRNGEPINPRPYLPTRR